MSGLAQRIAKRESPFGSKEAEQGKADKGWTHKLPADALPQVPLFPDQAIGAKDYANSMYEVRGN